MTSKTTPPLFCPLCCPKQNLRFFSKIPRFLNAFSAHRRRRRHKYRHHVRRLVRHHAVRRHEGAVQAQGILYHGVVIVFVLLLLRRRFIGFKERLRAFAFLVTYYYSGPKRYDFLMPFSWGSILDLRGGGGGALAGVEKRGRTPRRRDRSNR